MPVDQAVTIARCAQVAEDAAAELQATLKARRAPKRPEERMTVASVRYGIRWCKVIATRIHALDRRSITPQANGSRLTVALELLREMRPSIAGAHDSRWKTEMLRRIDAVLTRSD